MSAGPVTAWPAEIVARIDRRFDPAVSEPDGAVRDGLGRAVALRDVGKLQLTGAGDAGHQEIDDLDLIGEAKAEAGLVQVVKRVEDRSRLASVKASIIDRNLQFVVLAEISHLDAAAIAMSDGPAPRARPCIPPPAPP